MDLVCHVITSQLPGEGHAVAVLDAIAHPAVSSPGTPIRGANFVKIVP